MPSKLNLSLAAFTGITLGTLLVMKAKKALHRVVANPIDNSEDSYVSTSWSAAEKSTPAYKKQLNKWGTKQGLIEVRDDSAASFKKKRQQRLKQLSVIQKQGRKLSNAHSLNRKENSVSSETNTHAELLQNSEVTQVILTNNTDTVQKASLWGANAGNTDNLSEPIVVGEEEFTATVGIHPQNAIYNPVNGLFYVVNQLSDSVSVLNDLGVLIRSIDLGTGVVGAISPVDLTVNTNFSSASYGTIYVIGSVANQLYEIDLKFKVIASYPTGKRPIAIAFNESNAAVYIANLVSNEVTVFDTNTKMLTVIQNLDSPKSIGIHNASGNIYVFNSDTQTISVFDSDNKLLVQDIEVGTSNGKFGYHPVSNTLYFSITDSNQIVAFDNKIFSIKQTIEVGNAPFTMAYHTITKQLYVANRTDQTYSLIDASGSVSDTIVLTSFDTGLAISTKNDIVLSTAISSGAINIKKIIRTPAISFNEEYNEYREDFQHNPAVLQHLRVINSGAEKLNALQLIEKSVTGKEICTTHYFRNYDSPQNFANVSELYDVKEAVIDGRNSWCLNVPPKQTITLLLYHKQFEVYDLLPETSRKVVGVEMSKGIPKHWN
ncbi:YncE family protein [Aquimarina agarivorans]|uniref:YncE family protein n=1 Tax=Aquimarina agarivorans TaxID=980584 RepID=UPI000248FC52|nr:YncE family protein [Aquimarina agarivorans]